MGSRMFRSDISSNLTNYGDGEQGEGRELKIGGGTVDMRIKGQSLWGALN